MSHGSSTHRRVSTQGEQKQRVVWPAPGRAAAQPGIQRGQAAPCIADRDGVADPPDPHRRPTGRSPRRRNETPLGGCTWEPRNHHHCQGWKIGAGVQARRRSSPRQSRPEPAQDERRHQRSRGHAGDEHRAGPGPGGEPPAPVRPRPPPIPRRSPARAARRPTSGGHRSAHRTAAAHRAAPRISSGWPVFSAGKISGLATQSSSVSRQATVETPLGALGARSSHKSQSSRPPARQGTALATEDRVLAAVPQRRDQHERGRG